MYSALWTKCVRLAMKKIRNRSWMCLGRVDVGVGVGVCMRVNINWRTALISGFAASDGT